MSIEESIQQIETLIEAWQLDEADLNQTDINAMQVLLKENQDLKKQVEENKDNYNCLLKQKEQFEYIMSKQVDYQGQQKEFKKYLEDEIKDTEKTIELLSDTRSSRIPILQYKKHIIEVILAKYKEIIGGNKDEK